MGRVAHEVSDSEDFHPAPSVPEATLLRRIGSGKACDPA